MGPESKVEYAWKDGNFIVNFSNVLAVVYDTDYAPVSFHISLSPTGDIEIFYDDYVAADFFQQGSTLFCGINAFHNKGKRIRVKSLLKYKPCH